MFLQMLTLTTAAVDLSSISISLPECSQQQRQVDWKSVPDQNLPVRSLCSSETSLEGISWQPTNNSSFESNDSLDSFSPSSTSSSSSSSSTTTSTTDSIYSLPPTPPATPPNSGHEWLQVESSESSKSVRFCCDSCSKVFADRAHLAEHRRYRHSDDRPHRCPECAKGFKSRSNLNQHIRTSHERPRFDCQVRLAKRFFPFLERFFFYSKIKFLDSV